CRPALMERVWVFAASQRPGFLTAQPSPGPFRVKRPLALSHTQDAVCTSSDSTHSPKEPSLIVINSQGVGESQSRLELCSRSAPLTLREALGSPIPIPRSAPLTSRCG